MCVYIYISINYKATLDIVLQKYYKKSRLYCMLQLRTVDSFCSSSSKCLALKMLLMLSASFIQNSSLNLSQKQIRFIYIYIYNVSLYLLQQQIAPLALWFVIHKRHQDAQCSCIRLQGSI